MWVCSEFCGSRTKTKVTFYQTLHFSKIGPKLQKMTLTLEPDFCGVGQKGNVLAALQIKFRSVCPVWIVCPVCAVFPILNPGCSVCLNGHDNHDDHVEYDDHIDHDHHLNHDDHFNHIDHLDHYDHLDQDDHLNHDDHINHEDYFDQNDHPDHDTLYL